MAINKRPSLYLNLLIFTAVLAIATVVSQTQPPLTERLSCGQVSKSLSSCVDYLKAGGAAPPPRCCDGVKSLSGIAKTPANRQAACRCIKSAAANIKGIKPELADGLPGQCGVNIPYKISPSIDCDSVH